MRQAARSLDDRLVQAILVKIDVQELLRLEQESVRIPSLTFEEHECARYFAREMERLGFDQVDLMEVEDPYGSGRRGLQPIGWLRGSGGGPGMMLNGHMDHVPAVGEWTRDPFSGDFDDGYVYGRGAHDDKEGSLLRSARPGRAHPVGVLVRSPERLSAPWKERLFGWDLVGNRRVS